MKINKIICDICGEEIDVEKDEAIAIFEHIIVKQKLNVSSDSFELKRDELRTDKELVRNSYDFCNSCANDIESFFIGKRNKKS